MGGFIAYVAIIAFSVGLGLWLSRRRLGELAPKHRRILWLMLVVATAISATIGWTLTHGHPVIAIAIMVVFFVLPSFVQIPIYVRRSRRNAEEARARRLEDRRGP